MWRYVALIRVLFHVKEWHERIKVPLFFKNKVAATVMHCNTQTSLIYFYIDCIMLFSYGLLHRSVRFIYCFF